MVRSTYIYKKFQLLILAHLVVTVLFSLLSCESEVDINADWTEITIVYGLINQLESDHYLRINKSFLGGNALHIAKIEDSSSYRKNLDVRLEGWGPDGPLYAIPFDTITVHGKDSGLWYNPYMMVYKGSGGLIPDLNYRLIIKNTKTGKLISSQTKLIRNFIISRPVAGGRQTFFRGNATVIEWSNGINARRYEPLVRFHYIEVPQGSLDSLHKYLDYSLAAVSSDNLNGTGSSETLFNNDGFYENLRVRLDNGFQGKRLCGSVDFIVYAGGEEYDTYMRVNGPSYSLVQDRPEYTNIDNGLGLFASRYSVTRSKRLDPRTEDEIIDLNVNFVKNPQL